MHDSDDDHRVVRDGIQDHERRRAAVTEAEGKRQATITVAEGDKQSPPEEIDVATREVDVLATKLAGFENAVPSSLVRVSMARSCRWRHGLAQFSS